MDRIDALALLTRYYAAFNAGDWQGMLDCLDENERGLLGSTHGLDDERVHDAVQGGGDPGRRAAALATHQRHDLMPGRP